MDIEELKAHYDVVLALRDRLHDERDRRYTEVAQGIALNVMTTKDEANERFKLLNELRGGVATKEEIAALEKIVELLRADLGLVQQSVVGIMKRGEGVSSTVVVMIAGGSLLLGVIGALAGWALGSS